MKDKKTAATILLVEDDLGDQELARRAFREGMLGLSLKVVDDGEEALDYLYRRGRYADLASFPQPDLVLLDLNLPGLDGRQVLEKIKGDPDLRAMPVLVFTTSRQEKDIRMCYEAGANSCIVKPASTGQFVKAVRAIEDYWFEVAKLPTMAKE